MKNKVLLVLGVLLAVVFVSNSLAPGPAAPTQRQPAAAAQRAAAEPAEKDARQAAQEIASRCRAAFEDNFPRQNEMEWSWETRTLTVSLWPSFFGAREANAALEDIQYLKKWNALLESLRETAAEMYGQFEAQGIPETTVRIDLYDNVDFSLLLASVSPAGVDFDLVDSTPAGQRIGQESSASAPGVSYIVNTASMVFHLPGCAAAQQMDAGNAVTFAGAREDLLAQGFEPCGRCDP